MNGKKKKESNVVIKIQTQQGMIDFFFIIVVWKYQNMFLSFQFFLNVLLAVQINIFLHLKNILIKK